MSRQRFSQRRSGRWGAACLVLIALLLVGCGLVEERPFTPLAQETGIAVGDPFVDFYWEMGGPLLFGYPLTEPFQAATDEPLLQYFQTMRLEFNGQQVAITPLGAWAFAGASSAVGLYSPPDDGRSRTFPQTGQTVWDQFLIFYEAHQGETLLGLPLSAQINEGGMRVQYFENGRLEWQPELPVQQRVQLTPLGQAHFQSEMAMVYQQITRNAGPIAAADLTHATVLTSVRAPILYAGDEQVLTVIVLRPDGRAVSDIQASVTITYVGQELVYDLGRTDAEGRIQAQLPLADVPPGQSILLDVRVYAPDGREIGRERLGFRTWW